MKQIINMLSQDEVVHIAKLAKIKLKNSEIEKFSTELSSILGFFADLQEVDTKGITETSQVTGLENETRPDEVKVTENEDELLECSPHPVENHSIKIPKIM